MKSRPWSGLLRNVRDRLDATMLVVEHDIVFIADLADRLVAMDRGTVLMSGATAATSSTLALVGGGLPRLLKKGWWRSGFATTTTPTRRRWTGMRTPSSDLSGTV